MLGRFYLAWKMYSSLHYSWRLAWYKAAQQHAL